MYYDTLVTPFPDTKHHTYQPIADAIDFSQPQTQLVRSIERTVHQSLEWETNLWPKDGRLNTNQITNCGGFAVVASELLDKGSIPNYIAFANGHFLNLAEVADESGRAHLQLVEAGAPRFGQPLSPLVTRGDTNVRQAIAEQGSAAVRIDTEALIHNAGYDPDKLSSELRYRWLYYIKGKSLYYGSDSQQFAKDPEWARRNRYSCIMQIYPSKVGRELIPEYGAFLLNARSHNPDRALEHLSNISGKMPEIDARADHEEIKILVHDLAVAGRVEDVITATYDYCSSFRISQDPRLKGLEAGLYYGAAVTTNDPACAGLAAMAYGEAAERASYKSTTYSGKLGKLGTMFGIGRKVS